MATEGPKVQWSDSNKVGGRYINSNELSSLPTSKKDVLMGTWAYCVDTQALYMYDATIEAWVEQ